MSKKKLKEVIVEETKGEDPGFYKGYDIEWLRKQTDHSDFGLVAEFDALKK